MKFRPVVFGTIAAGVMATQTFMPIVAHAASNMSSSKVQYAKTTFIIAGQPTLHPEHIVANDPWSGKATNWVPVYYLQEVLHSFGVHSEWNSGDTLNISSTPTSWTINTNDSTVVKNLQASQMQFSINGDKNTLMACPKLVAKDPASGVYTTYVPVYYVDLFLKNRLNMKAIWGADAWRLSPQTSYTPPTSIQSLAVNETGPIAIQYTPQKSQTSAVNQQVLSWLKSATTTTVNLPPSTPGLHFQGNIGPSRLTITMADKSTISIYPAYTVTASGNQGTYQVNYEPNVIAYVSGNQTTYLNSPGLYAWLKNNQWKTQFTSN